MTSKYELMYVIGSETSDDHIPGISDEVKKAVEKNGGIIEKFEDLGKKKLAYPIKNTKIGNYIVVNFSAPSDQVNDIEQKIRTNQNIIRHLMVNMDEAFVQMEKDRVVQAKLKIVRPKDEVEEKKKPSFARPPQADKKIQIDLDAEIEKALESEDLK